MCIFSDQTIRGMTALTISRAQRQDAGEYKLKIKNKLGDVTLTVKVIVQGTNTLRCNICILWFSQKQYIDLILMYNIIFHTFIKIDILYCIAGI